MESPVHNTTSYDVKLDASHIESSHNVSDHKQWDRWMIFIGCGLMIFLINIDTTIVNLALARMISALHITLSQSQWVINSYLVSTVVFLIMAGKLADQFGLKRIFLNGTLLFGLSSLLIGLSLNFTWVIIGRVLQGIGFASTLSLALIMIARSFPVAQRSFIMGFSITLTGLGQACGPFFGGLILEFSTWHWIFLINIPIVLSAYMIVSRFYLDDVSNHVEKVRIDYRGAIFLGIALTALIHTLNLITSEDASMQYCALFGSISILFFLALFFSERNIEHPMIHFELFESRNFTYAMLIRFFYMIAMGSFLFIIPLFLQNILDFSPFYAGLILMIFSLSFTLSSPFLGMLSDKVGNNTVLIVGCVASLAAFILLRLMPTQIHIVSLITPFILFGLSVAIIFPNTITVVLGSLPPHRTGEGSGLFFTMSFIGMSVGVAIMTLLLQLQSASTLMHYVHATGLSLSTSQHHQLVSVANGSINIHDIARSFSVSTFSILTPVLKLSFLSAFNLIMTLNVFVSLILVILSCVLFHRRHSDNLMEHSTYE